MRTIELKTYNQKNIQQIKKLGSSSYAEVNLFYDTKIIQQVVGKFFPFNGQKQAINKELVDAKREAKIYAQ